MTLYTFSGTVVDPVNGTPLRAARVVIEATSPVINQDPSIVSSGIARTDASGFFTISLEGTVYPEWGYSLIIRRDGVSEPVVEGTFLLTEDTSLDDIEWVDPASFEPVAHYPSVGKQLSEVETVINEGRLSEASLSGTYATAEQGGKADTAIQAEALTAAIEDALMLSPTAAETMPRMAATLANGWLSGTMRAAYFKAHRNLTVSTVATATASTPAAATPTLCRVGIYSVAPNGDLTLIGSTANDVTLWNTSNTLHTRNLSAPVNLVAGNTYAVGLLIVTSQTPPTIVIGGPPGPGTLHGASPRITSAVTGITDLPASVLAGALADTTFRPYAHLA